MKIITAMEKARRVSITTDIWSNKCSTNSFIGITAHLLNPATRKREVYRICCRVFDEKHSGANIAKMMKRLFSEFKIDKKVFRILSDNASNMVKAVRDIQAMEEGDEMEDFEEDYIDSDDSDCDSEPGDIENDDEEEEVGRFTHELEENLVDHERAFRAVDLERLGCFAHTMQLPINKCINKKKKCFGVVLRKTRKIVKKYRKSPKAKALLRRRVKNKLAGYVKTRWWTDVAMAKSVVKAAKVPGNPLNDMMEQMEWNIELNERDIASLESFISIMYPFQELSDKLGGEKRSTVQLVYPSLKEMFALIDEKIEAKEAKAFCQDLKLEMTKYFKYVLEKDDQDFNPLFVAATYLDPFYKLVLSDEMIEVAKEFLIKLVKKETEARDPFMLEEVELVEVQVTSKLVLPGLSRLSKDIMSKNKVVSGATRRSTNIDSVMLNEFENFERNAKKVFEKAVSQAEEKLKKAEDELAVQVVGSEDNLLEEEVRADGQDIKDAFVKPEDPLDFWISQV